jgi:hypothetical protein
VPPTFPDGIIVAARKAAFDPKCDIRAQNRPTGPPMPEQLREPDGLACNLHHIRIKWQRRLTFGPLKPQTSALGARDVDMPVDPAIGHCRRI